MYRQWIRNGYLTLVDEDSIDIDWVIKRIQQINDELPIGLIAYDSYHAQQLAVKCLKEGLPMKAVRQGISSFGEPTSELEQRILSKQVVIDDNPIIRWCFSNVLIKQDENANRKPVKSANDNKIDIVIGFIQSVKLWMEINGLDTSTIEAVALDA